MSVFSAAWKNRMLDHDDPDEARLHDGDPGAAGTANRVGDANGVEAAVWAAASSGSRALNADVEFSGLDADQSVTWYSAWKTDGEEVFVGKAQITSGDVAANAAGEYKLTTATALNLNNPA